MKEKDCEICYGSLTDAETWQLEGCTHCFHSECLRMHIAVNMEEGRFPVLCPQKDCGLEMQLTDISRLLSESELDKFYFFSFKHYAGKHPHELVGCPAPGCQFYAFRELSEAAIEHFCCLGCKTEICLKCNLPWHEGMTCQEARVTVKQDPNDQLFE